jgi:hypothetical protein
MTRNGKIARLPYDIREELNRRLRDGKSGPALLKWLNGEPECQKVLDEEFEGRPISKQNLSEWKQGGYKEWERKQETRERVQVMMEKATDLEKDAGGMANADRLGTILAADLVVAMEQIGSIEDPKERWARQKEIARELDRLRREDHHARKLRMAEEQWEIRSKHEAKEYERREKEAETERLLDLQEAMQNKPLVAALNEGKQESWKWTDWGIRVKYGLPMPKWWTNPQTAEEWAVLMRPSWWGDAENKLQASKHQASGEAPRTKEKAKGRDGTSPKSKGEAQGRGSRGRRKSPKRPGRVKPGPTRNLSRSNRVRLRREVPNPIRLRPTSARQELQVPLKLQ